MNSQIDLQLSGRVLPGTLVKSATVAAVSLALTATLLVKSQFSQEAAVQPEVEFQLDAMDDFDIEAGPLHDQLDLMLNSRRITYIYDFQNLNGVKGAAVHGQFSLDVALQKMFEGTGCAHQHFARSIEVFCATHTTSMGPASPSPTIAPNILKKRPLNLSIISPENRPNG